MATSMAPLCHRRPEPGKKAPRQWIGEHLSAGLVELSERAKRFRFAQPP